MKQTQSEIEVEKSIQLSNDRTGYYRKVALWRLADVVSVDAFVRENELGWIERSKLEFFSSPSVATSFVDIARNDI